MAVRIICQSTELAVECLRAAQRIGLAAEPEVHERIWPAAEGALQKGDTGIVSVEPPELDDLIRVGATAREHGRWGIVAVLDRSEAARQVRDVALDLGLCAVDEVDPLASALALVESGAEAPWSASTRTLCREDRARLAPALGQGTRSAGHVLRDASGLLRFAEHPEATGTLVGSARDLALAIAGLRGADRQSVLIESIVDDLDERAVLDVLFGPRRALSDPASKMALVPYGLPVPVEELCASASRAAAEATRIGYPVRIALASPDLRVWDHPDLSVDMVDNAARVRDTFRQLMTVAQARLGGNPAGQLAGTEARAAERILGVMVTATSEAAALLGVRAWPVAGGRVAMRIGFADAHGAAAGDETLAVLPAPVAGIERALRRLRGAELLLRGTHAQRRTHLDAVSDVLLRLSAFVNDRRGAVDSVELRPLALLLDGSVEIREACVAVSDAFERSLATPAAG
jgi:hypothetical protein